MSINIELCRFRFCSNQRIHFENLISFIIFDGNVPKNKYLIESDAKVVGRCRWSAGMAVKLESCRPDPPEICHLTV